MNADVVIVELLRYRGLLDRFEAGATRPSRSAPLVPFGGVDFSRLPDPPLRGLGLPQPRLERLLGERAGEFGADGGRRDGPWSRRHRQRPDPGG